MNLSQEIQKAVGAHSAWKLRLRTAAENGTSTFKVAAVAVDNQCDFGIFLHSVVDPATRKSTHFQTCNDLHARFHKTAALVLQLALDGRKEAAAQALSPQSDFDKISRALTLAMMKWHSSI
jgi:hypothetical protein